jgi:hypothetical protein
MSSGAGELQEAWRVYSPDMRTGPFLLNTCVSNMVCVLNQDVEPSLETTPPVVDNPKMLFGCQYSIRRVAVEVSST